MADKKEKPAEYMSYPEYLVNIKGSSGIVMVEKAVNLL